LQKKALANGKPSGYQSRNFFTHPMRQLTPLLLLLPLLLSVGCTTQQTANRSGQIRNVRTTAYTHTEPGGSKNAIGVRLSNGVVKSAAADWSRFPIGTKFKLLVTGEVWQIDDYGSALVGTDTIDLYKTTRSGVRTWGVRHVDIQILEWGCKEKSLEILQPRTRKGHVRRMVADLREQS
jgi:3D (Asp-Asp-Asp) domain-containing protein